MNEFVQSAATPLIEVPLYSPIENDRARKGLQKLVFLDF